MFYLSYSYFNASTGFLVAAFQLCQLTLCKAIPNANAPDRAKIPQIIFAPDHYSKGQTTILLNHQTCGCLPNIC